MIGWCFSFAVGVGCGVLSGLGVGGGSLLLLYLTAAAGLPQQQAQGISLIYYLPAAGLALPAHIRQGDIEWKLLPAAIASGLVCTGLAAWAATALDMGLLRRLFGLFLLITGLRELFRKASPGDQPPRH